VAEDLTVSRPKVAPRERPKRRGARLHGKRFALAYALLALVLAAAAALLVYSLGTDEAEEEQAWSSWSPTKEGEARLWEIADFVSDQYTDAAGRPVVSVLAGPPSVQVQSDGVPQKVPLDGVIFLGRAGDRSDASAGIFDGDAAMFILCGRGPTCSVDPAAAQRRDFGVVLQREALELALYTLHYTTLESVLFFFPTVRQQVGGKVQALQLATVLNRSKLRPQLERPLADTLPGSAREPVEGADRSNVLDLVRLYTFTVEQAPQGSTVLGLTPLPRQ